MPLKIRTLQHIVLFILLLAPSFALYAQASNSYEPAIYSNEENLNKALTELTERLSKDEEELNSDKSIEKVQRKEIARLYQNRSQGIIDQIKEGRFLADDRIHDVVQKTFTNILRTNPDLPQDELRLFVSRNIWPNASCYGEGSLVINLGLLSRLENESQLAFILCHELAHYVQNHVNNKIKERINFLYSRETQIELRKIQKSDFGRYKKIQQMFGSALYSSRRHDRSRELEADSIGFFFLQNTRYDIKEAVNTLMLLDKIDKPKYLSGIDFKAHFDHVEYPFKYKWIAIEEDEFINGTKYQAWEIDSLKTHPSCQLRYDILSPQAPGSSSSSAFIQPVGNFAQMVQLAEFEIVESLYFFKSYGHCLHECLQYLEIYPSNAYLHARIVACLHHIWVAKQEHEIGKVVTLPDEEQTASYWSLNTMLYDMSMRDYAKIAHYYVQKHKSAYLTDEHFLYSVYLAADMMDDQEGMQKSKSAYQKLFPEGLYVEGFLD